MRKPTKDNFKVDVGDNFARYMIEKDWLKKANCKYFDALAEKAKMDLKLLKRSKELHNKSL